MHGTGTAGELDVDAFQSYGCYDLLVHAGDRPELLIAVTSMGVRGVRPDFEWVGTTLLNAAGRHVMFLRDNGQSWFNDDNGWEELIAAIGAYRIAHGIERMFAFGLSLGAFGAALLATRLPLTGVLLLAPQASIGREEAGFDNRFAAMWESIASRNRPDLSGLRHSATRIICCFSVDDVFDLAHAELLRNYAPHAELLPIRGDHNLGNELQWRHQHDAMLHYLMDDGARPDLRLFQGDLDFAFSVAPRVLAEDRSGFQEHVAHMVRTDRAHHIPGALFPELNRALRPPRGSLRAGLHKLLGWRAYPAQRGMSFLLAALEPYLHDGWSAIDDGGFWAESPRARLRLRMIDPDRKSPFRLAIGGRLRAAGEEGRMLRVRQGRRLLGEVQAAAGEPSGVGLVVEARGPLIDLRFETDLDASGAPLFWINELRVLCD